MIDVDKLRNPLSEEDLKALKEVESVMPDIKAVLKDLRDAGIELPDEVARCDEADKLCKGILRVFGTRKNPIASRTQSK